MLMMGVMLSLSALTVMAQRGAGQGGGGQYNPATEITLRGTVEEVKQIPGPRGGLGGTHLMLKTDKETLDVHLGPTTFLEKEKSTFAKGDEIQVIGSRVKIEGADALIAREVKKGDKTLTLRNEKGIPLWAGRKRG
jgi:hypothetical protein